MNLEKSGKFSRENENKIENQLTDQSNARIFLWSTWIRLLAIHLDLVIGIQEIFRAEECKIDGRVTGITNFWWRLFVRFVGSSSRPDCRISLHIQFLFRADSVSSQKLIGSRHTLKNFSDKPEFACSLISRYIHILHSIQQCVFGRWCRCLVREGARMLLNSFPTARNKFLIWNCTIFRLNGILLFKFISTHHWF